MSNDLIVPVVDLSECDIAIDEVAPWVVAGLSGAAAAVFVAWCRRSGGSPQVSFGWRGFSVRCFR